MPNKPKGEPRLTKDPKYYTMKVREWNKSHPLHYCVEINGVLYAFTKDKIIKKIRNVKNANDIVIIS